MAKRKAALATKRKRSGTRTAVHRSRSQATSGSRSKKSAARKSAVRKNAARKRSVSKSPARKSPARKNSARKSPARKNVRKIARMKTTVRRSPAHGARSVPSGRPTVTLASVRRVPALNRERRVVNEDDSLQTAPSSLNLDKTASSVPTGRHELDEWHHDHTETGSALTGGDNPTFDQAIIDDIGKGLGDNYGDNEELKREEKISDRDKRRWELDPKSPQDYDYEDQ